jgi:anti-anti-sigma factor
VRLGGAVGVANVAEVGTGILDVLGRNGSDVIVDLRDVTLMDWRVVRAFLLVLRQAEERKHAIVVIRPHARVWRTFELAGLDGAFPNCADPTDVLRPDAQRGRPLTPRERRVLFELACGRTTENAAAAIGLSPHTVRSHLKSAARKLGAETRAQAVAIAITQGAIQVGAPRGSVEMGRGGPT